MKRRAIIRSFFLLLLSAIGIFLFLVYSTYDKTEKEIDHIVQPMIEELFRNGWDVDTVYKYASLEFKQLIVDKKMNIGIHGLDKLGKVKQYKGIVGSKIGVRAWEFAPRTATVTALVELDSGEAAITLQLSKTNNSWFLDGFNISSAHLFDILNKKANEI